jgi:hypothetical protein
MNWKTTLLSAAALVVLAAAPGYQVVSLARASECDAGDKIDGSTAAEATKKMESAGFRLVHDLKKGCDNYWHGIAVKDGVEGHVRLTPQGEVTREGN